MTHVEKPIFIVARSGEWVGNPHSPRHSIPCFGIRDDAEKFARSVAEAEDVPVRDFSVAEYTFSGNAGEVK